MKAKYIQKGDAVDYIPNQDMDAGEIVCLGDLIGITRIPIKAGTLGTLLPDLPRILELFLALPLKNPALTPNTSECF